MKPVKLRSNLAKIAFLAGIGLVVLIVGTMLLPIFSSTSSRGPATKLLMDAKMLGLAVTIYKKDHGGPPPELQLIAPAIQGLDIPLYPDLVEFPNDTSNLPRGVLAWLYFPPLSEDDSTIMLASPLPFYMHAGKKSGLKRIIVRGNTSGEIIDEVDFGKELEKLNRDQMIRTPNSHSREP